MEPEPLRPEDLQNLNANPIFRKILADVICLKASVFKLFAVFKKACASHLTLKRGFNEFILTKKFRPRILKALKIIVS